MGQALLQVPLNTLPTAQKKVGSIFCMCHLLVLPSLCVVMSPTPSQNPLQEAAELPVPRRTLPT